MRAYTGWVGVVLWVAATPAHAAPQPPSLLLRSAGEFGPAAVTSAGSGQDVSRRAHPRWQERSGRQGSVIRFTATPSEDGQLVARCSAEGGGLETTVMSFSHDGQDWIHASEYSTTGRHVWVRSGTDGGSLELEKGESGSSGAGFSVQAPVRGAHSLEVLIGSVGARIACEVEVNGTSLGAEHPNAKMWFGRGEDFSGGAAASAQFEMAGMMSVTRPAAGRVIALLLGGPGWLRATGPAERVKDGIGDSPWLSVRDGGSWNYSVRASADARDAVRLWSIEFG